MLNRSIYFFTFQITWIQPQVHNTQIISCCVSFLPNMHRAEEHMKQQNEKVVCDERATAAKFIENCFFFVFFFLSSCTLWSQLSTDVYVCVRDGFFFLFLFTHFAVSSIIAVDLWWQMRFTIFLSFIFVVSACIGLLLIVSFHHCHILFRICFFSSSSLFLGFAIAFIRCDAHLHKFINVCFPISQNLEAKKKNLAALVVHTVNSRKILSWRRQHYIGGNKKSFIIQHGNQKYFIFFSTSIFISWFCYFLYSFGYQTNSILCMCAHRLFTALFTEIRKKKSFFHRARQPIMSYLLAKRNEKNNNNEQRQSTATSYL